MKTKKTLILILTAFMLSMVTLRAADAPKPTPFYQYTNQVAISAQWNYVSQFENPYHVLGPVVEFRWYKPLNSISDKAFVLGVAMGHLMNLTELSYPNEIATVKVAFDFMFGVYHLQPYIAGTALFSHYGKALVPSIGFENRFELNEDIALFLSGEANTSHRSLRKENGFRIDYSARFGVAINLSKHLLKSKYRKSNE